MKTPLFMLSILACAVGLRAGTAEFAFFDRSGHGLNYKTLRKISNGTKGWDNDALVTLPDLRLAALAPLTKKLAVELPPGNRKRAFAINWPVEPLGYILAVVDMGGRGLSDGDKINFTYQAAKDMKRRLDRRVADTKYEKSERFSKAYGDAASKLEKAENAADEPEKGRLGCLALDKLAEAYDIFLSEYGTANAKKLAASGGPMLAFTIDRIDGYRKNIDLARRIAGKFAWIRLYLDLALRFSEYDEIVEYAKKKGVKILALPVDSSDAKKRKIASVDAYLQRFKDAIARWPEIDAWEVGNEVNGSWLPKDIDKKAAAATDYCRSKGKKTFLTLFWQINTDDAPYDLFTWIDKISPETRKKLDYVGLSIYPEQAPLGADAMDMVFQRLQEEFKDSKTGVAELGYWIKGQRHWWAYDKKDPSGKAAAMVENQYYRAMFAYPSSFGGGFWWNFTTEFDKNPALAKNIEKIAKDIAAP